MQSCHIFFTNTVLSAPNCRSIDVQYSAYLKHCKTSHQNRKCFVFYGGQFHFGYKPVKSGIIVLLLVVEYCFGFGCNLFFKANCIEHRAYKVFSQISVGNAETRLLYGNFSARFGVVNVVKSFAHMLAKEQHYFLRNIISVGITAHIVVGTVYIKHPPKCHLNKIQSLNLL